MTEDIKPDVLTELKAKANLMGISYSPNIGENALREKINKTLAADEPEQPVKEVTQLTNKQVAEAQQETMRLNALKLVRVIITPFDQTKKEHQGDFFEVANRAMKVKRLVLYNVETHIEQCLLDEIRGRKMQVFISRKTSRGEIREGKLVPAYGVNVLDQLTEKEIEDLRRAQAVRQGTE